MTELLEGKEVVFGKLKEQAEKAIEEDGADVIVLGSYHASSAEYLAANLPVPVFPGQVAYKFLETQIELGLTHSKRAFQLRRSQSTQILERDGIHE